MTSHLPSLYLHLLGAHSVPAPSGCTLCTCTSWVHNPYLHLLGAHSAVTLYNVCDTLWVHTVDNTSAVTLYRCTIWINTQSLGLLPIIRGELT